MDAKRDLLLRSGARLYSLGLDLDGAKERIRKLVGAGVPYESDEMVQAVSEYAELKEQWEALEKEYLALRDEITGSGKRPAGAAE